MRFFVFTQWQLLHQDVRFMIIDSQHISLYVSKSISIQTASLQPDPFKKKRRKKAEGEVLLHGNASLFLFDLPTDESAILLTDVTNIPQTAASHQQPLAKQKGPSADVQREDPRDSLYQGARQFRI